MAVARTELQVTWDTGNNSYSLVTATWAQTSDAMTMTATGFAATIHLKADQTVGTPASGDYVDFFAQLTGGDPDGAGADEYDTDGHDIFLCRIDVNVDDPGLKSVNFPVACESFKIRALGTGFTSTDAVSVSGTLTVLTA